MGRIFLEVGNLNVLDSSSKECIGLTIMHVGVKKFFESIVIESLDSIDSSN